MLVGHLCLCRIDGLECASSADLVLRVEAKLYWRPSHTGDEAGHLFCPAASEPKTSFDEFLSTSDSSSQMYKEKLKRITLLIDPFAQGDDYAYMKGVGELSHNY